MSAARIKLLIAYDGKPYDGWQSQLSRNGIQDHIEAAFEAIVGSPVRVHGSGRTDAGVHALGQMAHADVSLNFPVSKWALALNTHLPPQIRVLKTTRAKSDFHARFSAEGKVYRYRIWSDPSMHPLEIGRAWHVPMRLGEEQMRAALAAYLGTHNFKSFSANRGTPMEDTIRTIQRADLKRKGESWVVEFEGDGFLYKMVRMLTACAVRVAWGREPVEWIAAHLANPRQGAARYMAPAEGLYLVKVKY